ncbi:hypothetical protein AgCh_032463 [Apium graveolens]
MSALKLTLQETPNIVRAQIPQNPSRPATKTKGEMEAKLKSLHQKDIGMKERLKMAAEAIQKQRSEILSSCSSNVKHSTGIHQENDAKEEEEEEVERIRFF